MISFNNCISQHCQMSQLVVSLTPLLPVNPLRLGEDEWVISMDSEAALIFLRADCRSWLSAATAWPLPLTWRTKTSPSDIKSFLLWISLWILLSSALCLSRIRRCLSERSLVPAFKNWLTNFLQSISPMETKISRKSGGKNGVCSNRWKNNLVIVVISWNSKL